MNAIEQYLKSIKSDGKLSKERERELSDIIHTSKDSRLIQKAKEELIQSCLLLVVSRATKYMQLYHANMNLMELISEGNMALMKSVNYYRFREDACFSTYATTIIDHTIKRAIRESGGIHIPEHHLQYMSRIEELQEQCVGISTQELTNRINDEMPDEEEITADLVDRIKQSMEVRKIISLEDIKNGEGESIWEDTIEDTNTVLPSEATHLKMLKEYLARYSNQLTEIEKKSLDMFFCGEVYTFDEIATELGLSTERVRQTLFRAIRRMRIMMKKDIQQEVAI